MSFCSHVRSMETITRVKPGPPPTHPWEGFIEGREPPGTHICHNECRTGYRGHICHICGAQVRVQSRALGEYHDYQVRYTLSISSETGVQRAEASKSFSGPTYLPPHHVQASNKNLHVFDRYFYSTILLCVVDAVSGCRNGP